LTKDSFKRFMEPPWPSEYYRLAAAPVKSSNAYQSLGQPHQNAGRAPAPAFVPALNRVLESRAPWTFRGAQASKQTVSARPGLCI